MVNPAWIRGKSPSGGSACEGGGRGRARAMRAGVLGEHAAADDERVVPPRAGAQVPDCHAAAAARGVNEPTVAQRDAAVVDVAVPRVARGGVEADQVTGLQVVAVGDALRGGSRVLDVRGATNA